MLKFVSPGQRMLIAAVSAKSLTPAFQLCETFYYFSNQNQMQIFTNSIIDITRITAPILFILHKIWPRKSKVCKLIKISVWTAAPPLLEHFKLLTQHQTPHSSLISSIAERSFQQLGLLFTVMATKTNVTVRLCVAVCEVLRRR